MKKLLVLTLAFTISALSNLMAEPQSVWSESESVRTIYCHENRFPALNKFELGGFASYAQLDEYFINQVDPKCYKDYFVPKGSKRGDTTLTPYARYGAYDNLTLYSRVPIDFVNSDVKGKTAGLNDIAVGAELLAYEYTYRYPWVVPYIEVTFPTGDSKNHMGVGKVDPIFGMAVGTTTFDQFDWILDGRYDANGTADGMFEGAAALIWKLSDQFSILGEVKITEKQDGSTKGTPTYFNAGFSYKPTDAFNVNLYAGTSANAEENGHGTVKLAYNF